jgi:CRP-like cAMP-binding protein
MHAMNPSQQPREPAGAGARVRPLTEFPELAARAAEMLRTPSTLLPLTPDDVQVILAQMGLARFGHGTALMREGEADHADHLLLVLDGQVEVSIGAGDAPGALCLSVLGPGSVVGEMSVLDGAPRSATCTAVGTVLAAGLTRRGLERLIDAHPRAAARLLLGLTQRMADRLRALGEQVKLYAQLSTASAGPGVPTRAAGLGGQAGQAGQPGQAPRSAG